jgi:hypothetical protein
MSWSRRSVLRFGMTGAAVLASGSLLAACGFRPLYGQASTTPNSGATVDAHLAGIRVKAPVWERSASPYDAGGDAKHDARTSQILHNALRDGLNPYGQPTAQAYNLSIELSEKASPTLASDAGDIDRYNLVLNAHFFLGDANGEEILLEDIAAIAAFAVVKDPYLDIIARNDARERAARQLAELLKFRLSAHFSQHG